MRLALAVAALLIAATPAGAATVEIREGALLVSDYDGVVNDIEVRATTTTVIVVDEAVRPVAGPGCTDAGDRIVCTPGRTLTSGLIEAGGGDDRVVLHGMPDILTADGGPGADVLRAIGGSPVLKGGAGPDVLDAEGGVATVSYAGRTAPVRVTPDAVADDGQAGEGDLVTSAIRLVEGGEGPDVLFAPPPVGPPAPGWGGEVRGGAGDDVLTGSAAADRLDGGQGADVLAGSAGDDRLDGGPGADRLVGGGGLDAVIYSGRLLSVRVTIGTGADDGEVGEGDDVAGDITRVETGGGHDVVVGTDAREEVSTGWGNDVVVLRGGDDRAQPGDGDDRVDAGDGRDQIDLGSAGADVVDGGPGADAISGAGHGAVVRGGPGRDRVHVSGDAARIELRDRQRDELWCSGVAKGVVRLDRIDGVRYCRPVLWVERTRVRARRDGSFALRFSCGAGTLGCRGSLLLHSRPPGQAALVTNRRDVRVRAAGHATYRFRLGPLSRRRLAVRRTATFVIAGGSVRGRTVTVLAPHSGRAAR